MVSTQAMVSRLGLLGLALIPCALKFLYTFTLELHTMGGSAAYILMLHDTYVVMTAWTVLLAVLVVTTGAAAISDMGNMKFLHSAYFTSMAAVAAYSVLNDIFAISGALGAHSTVLVVQLILEVVVVGLMGQQLWAAVRHVGEEVVKTSYHSR